MPIFQETAETEGAQIEVFLNSVPILQKLSPEERFRLAGALEEQVFTKDQRVVQQVRLSQACRRNNLVAIGGCPSNVLG